MMNTSVPLADVTTKTSLGVIWNPAKVDEEQLRAAVADVFEDEAEIRWWTTTVEDPGRGMAREAVDAGCEIIVVVGGDGTVRAVSDGLLGSKVQLGIVPHGTGNLLARNLDIPLGDIPAALARIKAREPRVIDLGVVEYNGVESAFAVMVGFGLDAQMLVETDEDLKDRAGWLAYVEAMGRALAGTEMMDVTVTLDDDEPVVVRGHTMIVGNCGLLQGGIRLLPDAVVDDGLLDMLLVSAEGALQWMGALRSVVWDNGIARMFREDNEVVSTANTRHVTAKRVVVELETPQNFEIDGEELGEVSRFVVRVEPGALTVL